MSICNVDGCDTKSRANGYCNKHNLRFRKYGNPLGGVKNQAPMEERFWRRVEKTNDCWWWRPTRCKNTYGLIQMGGKGTKSITTHRYSYTLHHGEIPDGMLVMHSCDNPACVNPYHLSLGSHKDNVADMIQKGRRGEPKTIGEQNPKAVLNEDKVRYIRSMPNASHASLARELGVGTSTVRGVRTGRTWSHIK